MKSATIEAVIPPDRRLVVEVPDEIPAGPAEVTVRSVESASITRGTGADLLASGLYGIWGDRTEVTDGVEFARQLRQQAERRQHE
jgi:hypothetical protein